MSFEGSQMQFRGPRDTLDIFGPLLLMTAGCQAPGNQTQSPPKMPALQSFKVPLQPYLVVLVVHI